MLESVRGCCGRSRGRAWRCAGLLLVAVPLAASEFARTSAPARSSALALLVTAGSSAAVLVRRASPASAPRRGAALHRSTSSLDHRRRRRHGRVAFDLRVPLRPLGHRRVRPAPSRPAPWRSPASRRCSTAALVFGRTVLPDRVLLRNARRDDARSKSLTIFLNSRHLSRRRHRGGGWPSATGRPSASSRRASATCATSRPSATSSSSASEPGSIVLDRDHRVTGVQPRRRRDHRAQRRRTSWAPRGATSPGMESTSRRSRSALAARADVGSVRREIDRPPARWRSACPC